MKKTLTIVALILAISVSLIAGTMSYYYTQLDPLSGSVQAKSFILKYENGHGYSVSEKSIDTIRIAPGETVLRTFNISSGSDTGMDIAVFAVLKDKDGQVQNAKNPLKVIIKDSDGKVVESGNMMYRVPAGLEAHKSFSVTVGWPWGEKDNNDINFAGKGLTTLEVYVTGSQTELVKPNEG